MHTRLILLGAGLALITSLPHAAAQGTAFTYQGRLNASGSAAAGNYDLTFSLYNGSSAGATQLGATLTNLNVAVSGGLFTVTLDFGANFPGGSRWLAVGVRTNGSGAFTALTPWQALAPTPYAIFAPNAGTAASASGFSGALAGDVTGSQGATAVAAVGGQTAANLATGAAAANGATPLSTPGAIVRRDGAGNFAAGTITAALAGSGAALTNLNASQLSSGVVPQAVLPGFQAATGYSTIGGGYTNGVGGTAATVAGGYDNAASTNYAAIGGGIANLAAGVGAFIGGGHTNTASGPDTVVGGGYWNWSSNLLATISGGSSNLASGVAATVAGGSLNGATTNYAVVVGGLGNYASGAAAVISGGVTNAAVGFESAVGGGEMNLASGGLAAIPGGYDNLASGYESVVAGGQANAATATLATVGGGYGNLATNYAATVPGGYGNIAGGLYSFAAGAGAVAAHDGSFVWADESSPTLVRSTATNQFTARSAGGVRFLTTPTSPIGVQLAAGGNSWSATSDRNVKENFKPVDPRAVLQQLVATPVTEWNLISQDPSVRHIGPMAQDFKAAFGVGEDDRHISNTDADGVAFAAIQGLYQELKERDARIAALEARLKELESRLSAP